MKKDICNCNTIKKIVLFVLLNLSLHSMGQTIERKVISSGGINYQSATLNVTSTIGETFITTIGNSGLILTQGFQQPTPYSCPFVLNNGNDTIAACGTSYTLDAGADYSTYSWSTGSTSQTATITSTGWYNCTITQGLCTSSDSVFVSLLDANIYNSDTIICGGATVALSMYDSLNVDTFSLPSNLKNGLVLYYPFNGNSNDESGNGNNGILSSSPPTLTTDRFGIANSAYDFGLYNLISKNINNLNTFSVSAWVQYSDINGCTSISLGNQGSYFASHKASTNYGNGFAIGQVNGNWSWINYNTSNNPWQQYPGPIQLNRWYHIVQTYEPSGKTYLYIDGVNRDSMNYGPVITGGNNYEFKVGGEIDGNTVCWFKGKIDDVMYYNRAISLSEVNQIYNLGSSLSYSWSNGATTPTISVTPTQTTTYYCTVSNGISSCTDSVTVTVNSTSTSIDSVIACDSYQWNGSTYTSSGTYTYTTTNTVGCDSVATLNLIITPSSINTTSITSCGSYTWSVNGQTYAQSGTYSSQISCHTETLNLTVLPVPSIPVLACYQTASFNTSTCTWDISGVQPTQPTLACYESANFNTTTCTWDITGVQPTQPTLACYESANFNTTTCAWDISGVQPTQPTLACYDSAVFNNSNCQWDVSGTQPTQPSLACYETANFNTTTCTWDITGVQPTQLTLACYESANFNTTTCTWDITGVQPTQPSLACYEYTNFNTTTCAWDVIGAIPAIPTLACYETATFNSASCQWDVTGNQPAYQFLACYQTAVFNDITCQWDISGTQPTQPSLACYETASFNISTCQWEITGSPAAAIITTTTQCDSYQWTANGQVYTQSGTYSYAANCQDYTLNLTISNSTVYYQDQDYDGYGSNTSMINSCNGAPVGYIAVAGDCNDNNTNINPGASEICGNGIDDNCDGNMDEGCGCINPPTAFAGSDTSICAGNNISLNGTIGGGASNAVWSTNGSGTFVPAANVLNATYVPSATDISSGAVTLTLTTNANAPCNVAVSSKNVTINPLPLSSGLISGLTEICYPLNNIFTYSINPVPGATSYTWSVPPGTVIQGSATGTSIQVKFINDNVHASIVGSITVTANNSNGCGSSTPSSLTLQVHISAPIQPCTISGPVSACNGIVGIYSVAPVFRAISYNWTVPTGATIINGAGSNIITVQYGAGFTGGTISVSATNICGTGAPRTRTVTRNVLTAPKSINGPVEGLCNATSATYSIAPVNGANSYNWTLPLGATIISGAGSNAITVEFNNSFTSGSITVAAVNACGVGLARSIMVKAVPGIPTSINGPVTSCVNSNKSYSTPPVVGAMSYTWTVPNNAIINSGQGTKNINITYGSLASNTGIITVKAINSCGASNVRVLSVKTTNCPRAGNSSGFVVNLFPNPTSGILNIESNELINRIELFDMLGKLVMTYGNERQIDISNLQSGLYLLRFTSDNGVELRRVEVSR